MLRFRPVHEGFSEVDDFLARIGVESSLDPVHAKLTNVFSGLAEREKGKSAFSARIRLPMKPYRPHHALGAISFEVCISNEHPVVAADRRTPGFVSTFWCRRMLRLSLIACRAAAWIAKASGDERPAKHKNDQRDDEINHRQFSVAGLDNRNVAEGVGAVTAPARWWVGC